MKALWLALGCALSMVAGGAQAQIPHLERRGAATQLIVDGKPFLALAGELHNSSATSRAYMAPIWAQLAKANINTVLAAVPWGVVEPQEGRFDFTMVDQLIEDARAHDQRLVLLWFGSWKNGLSHYAPLWVKQDVQRFPRVLTRSGNVENLTPLSNANLQADAAAFAALMRHVKAIDGAKHTVLMVQVENEVGLLGDARDRSPLGDQAFAQAVPPALIAYLQANRDALKDRVRAAWATSHFRTSGSWGEVFGTSPAAEEIFMAWHYARYLNGVVEAGKHEYPLPMFVNAWILQPDDEWPGEYPAGGPQAHNLDIWRAATPAIDILAPDIYLPDYKGIASEFARPGEAFFGPEARHGADGAGNALLAVGRFGAIGYSPFGVPYPSAELGDDDALADVYALLGSMAPMILEAQAKGDIAAVAIDAANPTETVSLGGYRLNASLPVERRSGKSPAQGYALILATGPDEYWLAGRDIQLTFTSNLEADETVGLGDVEEGSFAGGVWQPGRNLSGDEIMIRYDIAAQAAARQTGSGVKFTGPAPSIQRVRLYRFPHGK